MQTIKNWENTLGKQESTPSIWVDFLNFFEQLTWNDYLIILFLLIFALIGFKRGFALGFINFAWVVAALIFSGFFYQVLSNDNIFWLFTGQPLVSFVVLFLGFLLLKIGLYKILQIIAKIHGPCPLNRFLAIFIGMAIALGVSWVLTNDIIHIEIVSRLITHQDLLFIVTATLVFGATVITAFVLIKMLNIKVGTDQPCPLLLALKPLDSILNAKNVNSPVNHFFGLWLGLFKGLIVVVVMIVALNHSHYLINGPITDKFNAVANNTQAVLSDYLTFIER